MALAMQAGFAPLRSALKLGYDLALGIGVAQGFATLGAFGFEDGWTIPRSAAWSISHRAYPTKRKAARLIDRRTRCTRRCGGGRERGTTLKRRGARSCSSGLRLGHTVEFASG
jgi:hypothetical protein